MHAKAARRCAMALLISAGLARRPSAALQSSAPRKTARKRRISMPVKTAWPGAAWLLASALLSSPLAAADEPRTELAQTKAQILRCDDGSLTPQEDEEVCAQAVDRLWELMRQSVVGFLSAHPKASAREVQAHL